MVEPRSRGRRQAASDPPWIWIVARVVAFGLVAIVVATIVGLIVVAVRDVRGAGAPDHVNDDGRGAALFVILVVSPVVLAGLVVAASGAWLVVVRSRAGLAYNVAVGVVGTFVGLAAVGSTLWAAPISATGLAIAATAVAGILQTTEAERANRRRAAAAVR